MKTKYNLSFIILGVLIGSSIATSRMITPDYDASTIFANIITFILAVLFVGYGFKLRLLAKKGVSDTKDIKK